MREENATPEETNNEELLERQVIDVDVKQSPIRLDKFLMDRLYRVSRNRVQAAIRAGAITINDKEVKPNHKVRPGDQISIVLPRPPGEGTKIIPQDLPLDIRYEDDDLMIVYKPPGLVVHPGIGHRKGTLVNALAYHFESLPVLHGNDADKLGLVHRIDKNTSGLLVVAKTEYAMHHLAKQFFNHTTQRTYYAIVWGEPDPPKGTIEANVGRHPRFRKQFTTFTEEDKGKWAVTHYEVVEPLYYISLIKCHLETGRTHQIRVHMKHIGHPLFNDEKYGGDRIVKGTVFSKYKLFVERTFNLIPRHALHAQSLGFVHPRTGKEMYFETDLPIEFQETLEAWRKYLRGRKAAVKNL